MRIQDKNKKRMSKPGGSSQPPNIHESVESGDLSGVQRLLSQDPSLLNQKSDDTALETPLHASAGNNKIEITNYLLEWKGQGELELEAKNAYGETPLHVAAKNGYTETVRILLQDGANIEARNNSSMTPLHLAVGYALRSGENSAVKTLLEFNADISSTDEEGMTPSNYLPMSLLQDDELLRLLSQNAASTAITHDSTGNNTNSRCGNVGPQNDNNNNGTAYFSTGNGCDVIKTGMDEFENELSNLVGQHELKSQLRKWAKGLLLDEKRRAMGLDLGPRKRPHMAFLGNPGTGKTTIARILGRLLRSIGVLLRDKVTKVKSSDLVGENLVQNAKRKIEEATGGILLADEAYLLAREQKEALQEIMSASDNANLVVIFAGYADPMKRAFGSNPEFRRAVTATNSYEFNDFSSSDLAEMVTSKMNKQDEKSRLCGFKLHPACTHDALVSVIEKNSTEKLRSRLNGRLVDCMLNNARENLDSRLTLDSRGDELLTITLMDLEVGIRTLGEMVDVA